MDGERRTPGASAVAVREGRSILPHNREEELANECGVKRKEAYGVQRKEQMLRSLRNSLKETASIGMYTALRKVNDGSS
jgi:hypothetical protein